MAMNIHWIFYLNDNVVDVDENPFNFVSLLYLGVVSLRNGLQNVALDVICEQRAHTK